MLRGRTHPAHVLVKWLASKESRAAFYGICGNVLTYGEEEMKLTNTRIGRVPIQFPGKRNRKLKLAFALR